MDNLEYKGFWWLPETPDNTIPGFLAFTQQKGASLELLGSFDSLLDNTLKNYPIILGKTTNGKSITLYNCLLTNHSMSFGGSELSNYRIHYIFAGVHISSKEMLKFDKAQIDFTYLYDWVGVSGILPDLSKYIKENIYQVTYTTPENISVNTEKGNLNIIFSANIKFAHDISNLNEKTWLHIKANEEMSLNEFFKDFLQPLNFLIVLGTAKPNFVEKFYLFQKGMADNPIEVYYRQKFYQPKAKDNLLPYEMIFTLRDIYDELESRINHWLTAFQELDSVLHLFNTYKIAPEMFLELKFLTIAQAIETYHRRRKESAVLSKDDHKRKMKEIIESIPEEHRDWVKQALAFSNEKSLKMRLDELMAESLEVMNPLVRNHEEFVKSVKDTRNYYTHYDKRTKEKAAKGESLLWLTEKLSILLQSCLMNEIGISSNDKAKLFGDNKHYGLLTQHK